MFIHPNVREKIGVMPGGAKRKRRMETTTGALK